MNEYDFSKLNDKEFEALSIDLIAKLEGRRIERFKPGKDAGVDGRFFTIPIPGRVGDYSSVSEDVAIDNLFERT